MVSASGLLEVNHSAAVHESMIFLACELFLDFSIIVW